MALPRLFQSDRNLRTCRNLSRSRVRSAGFEHLEVRTAMAVDAFGAVEVVQAAGEQGALVSGQQPARSAPAAAAQPDLVQFAKNLTAAGVKFYGAAWCPHCTAQKELFQDGQNDLPFIDVTNPNHSQKPEFASLNIQEYPTWVFPDGTRLTGTQSLDQISSASKVAIPQGTAPYVQPIANTTLLVGSPLMLPIDGYDPNGQELTYTVTSDNPLVTATRMNGRSIRMSVAGHGDMLFKLFEDQAPLATSRMIQLSNADHYNNVIFHRLIKDFMVQGGGESSLGSFDDQFNIDLQHNRAGLLSMAKSTDDTNSSQFFITDAPTRHLDFNHTVFGVLVEGDKNRDAIMDVPTVRATPQSNEVSKPSPYEVRFANRSSGKTATQVFDDKENAVFMLKAAPNATGTATITVTARDADGEAFIRQFQLTLQQDAQNSAPFLNPVQPVSTTIGTPVSFQLTAQDVEGDAVVYPDLAAMRQYFVQESNPALFNTNLNYTVNRNTGLVTVTPTADQVGVFNILVGASSGQILTDRNNNQFYADSDTQVVQVTIAPPPPALPQGGANVTTVNGQNYTNANTVSLSVPNVRNGAAVELYRDGEKIADATATGQTAVFTVNLASMQERSYRFTARQVLSGAASNASAELNLVLDRTGPSISSLPPTQVLAGQVSQYRVTTTEDGTGLIRYELTSNGLSNISIDAATGVVSWAPTLADFGPRTFQVGARDAAGNLQTQTVNLRVQALRWNNPIVAEDVNNDGVINNLDVQAFVEVINRDGARPLGVRDTLSTNEPVGYYDVDLNGRMTPLDALRILDSLFSRPAAAPPMTSHAFSSSQEDSNSPLAADVVLAGALWSAWTNGLADQNSALFDD